MKKPRFLYVWIGMAVLVAAVGIIGIVCLDRPEEKPSVTLPDGTIITVEKAEVFSTWPERFRGWLGKSATVDGFLKDTLGWRQGWRDVKQSGGTYWEKDYAVSLKLSVNKLDRFKRIKEDPLLWLTVPDSSVYQFTLFAVNGEESAGSYFTERFDENKVCDTIFETESGKPLDWVLVFLYTIKGPESVYIPLQKGISGKEPAYSPSLKDYKPLPADEKIVSIPGMMVRLNALPVDISKNNGVKVWEEGTGITAETAIYRWIPEPPDIESWKTTGAITVRLSLAKKFPEDKSKVEIPPFRFSDMGEFKEWDSALLNPEFPKSTIYCVNKGVYYFSGNPDKGGMKLKIAAKSKQEKNDEFKAVLEAAKTKNLERRIGFIANGLWSELYWAEAAGDYSIIMEVPQPFLFLMPDKAWSDADPLLLRTVCWRKGAEGPTRVNVSSRGWVGTAIPECSPEEGSYQLTIGESFYGWASFRVILSDADREAWAAHWLEEKAKREKEKQETDSVSSSPGLGK